MLRTWNILGWIFVVLYTLSMLRPVMPYVEYELNKDYIKEFLCVNRDKPRLKCDGKCHLTQELKKAQSDVTDSQEPTELPTINLKDYPVAIDYDNRWKVENPLLSVCCPPVLNKQRISSGFTETLIMPPECA